MSLALYVDFISSTYEYREYIKQSVIRDLKKKYKRSSLGYIWSMLNPLLMMIILAAVFQNIMHTSIDNYPVFLFSGMMAWSYFRSTCDGALYAIRGNSRLINQLPIPKFVFIVSVAVYNLVDFFLHIVPLLLVMIFTGHPISPAIFAFPLVLLPLVLFSIGVGSIFAVMNVFFLDTEHLVGVLLQGLYFLCPILYAKEMLPEWLRKWVVINPLFGIIEQMRTVFYEGQLPSLNTYLLVLAGSSVVLALGLWVFRRSDSKFIYYI